MPDGLSSSNSCIYILCTSTRSVSVSNHSGNTSYHEEHTLCSTFEVARVFCHPTLDGWHFRCPPPSMLQVAYSDPDGLNYFEQFLPPEPNRKLWNTLDLPLAEGVVVSFYSWSTNNAITKHFIRNSSIVTMFCKLPQCRDETTHWLTLLLASGIKFKATHFSGRFGIEMKWYEGHDLIKFQFIQCFWQSQSIN